MADKALADNVLEEGLDKVEEYFKIKGMIKTLRDDIKDYKAQMDDVEELETISKKTKELREKINDDETIKDLTEKVSTMKERLELIRELIRIELLENAQEEVKRDGKKLKIVNILKEMKDDESKGKKKR